MTQPRIMSCPNCGSNLQVYADNAGNQHGVCPSCGTQVNFPADKPPVQQNIYYYMPAPVQRVVRRNQSNAGCWAMLMAAAGVGVLVLALGVLLVIANGGDSTANDNLPTPIELQPGVQFTPTSTATPPAASWEVTDGENFVYLAIEAD